MAARPIPTPTGDGECSIGQHEEVLPYAMHVVPDEDLGEPRDVLIGRDFMQKYGVSCSPRKRKVAFDRTTLALSDFVR